MTDHDLLLQLERANEALTDRVDAVEGEACDCNCADLDTDDLRDRVVRLNNRMQEMADLIVQLAERVLTLERDRDQLLVALEHTLLQ